MIVYAAIELREGRVVQVVGGRMDNERLSLPDPVAVAKLWVDSGLPALHVVDLDAVVGEGSNLDAIADILDAVDVPVQVGGGVRDEALADELFERGAARVIVGTRAVDEPEWLEALAERRPGRVVVAADVRGDEVVTRGWTAGAGISIQMVLRRVERLPLAGVLVTDVGREGRMAGVDANRFRELASLTRHPLLAAGGVAGVEDLRDLARAGVAGAVLGMALYTGWIDAARVAAEFGSVAAE